MITSAVELRVVHAPQRPRMDHGASENLQQIGGTRARSRSNERACRPHNSHPADFCHRHVQIPLYKKIAVSLIFATGFLALICSVLAVYYRVLISNGNDGTWYNAQCFVVM
jgi:hypothetical protein